MCLEVLVGWRGSEVALKATDLSKYPAKSPAVIKYKRLEVSVCVCVCDKRMRFLLHRLKLAVVAGGMGVSL